MNRIGIAIRSLRREGDHSAARTNLDTLTLQRHTQ